MNEPNTLDRLMGIMDELREKCPWDRKQTIESLRPMTIEETYELGEAVINGNWQEIKEELGDLLLHIVFYTRIAREQKAFAMEDVIETICEKLISRHPHIYGDVQVENEEDVKRNWERLKLKEGKTSVLAGVPVSLPATIKALRMQEKAKKVGFEWDHKEDVWKKVEEEQAELLEAEASGDRDRVEEEFGDLMFSLINYARFLHIDPETALEKTNRKFKSRFEKMEKAAMQEHKDLASMTLAEMDVIWNKVKKENI